ncbi:MAG: cupin domain-containing protein [Phycisphaerales bacterium]|jgi:quercetin dioxygenase-like cupin family protein|nr:cupin domain-containing protein [Phycisphaerales bacterium]
MHVRTCDPAQATEVSADDVTGVAMQMMVGREDAAPNFAMRHFVVAPGGHTPLHQHPWEHEVYVVEGHLQAECNGERRSVSAGDVLLVPSGSMHQFVNSSDADARFLCLVPLASECGQDVPGS